MPCGAQRRAAEPMARWHLLGHRVLPGTQAPKVLPPASSPPSHGMDAATPPSLPSSKASPSPWSEHRPVPTAGPHAQAGSVGSTPVHGTRCAPARSHLTGCWSVAACLETSARKEPPVNDLVKLGYPNVQIFTEETPGGAVCQRSSPAADLSCL